MSNENRNESGLPAARDAEMGLICSVVLKPEAADDFADLPPEAFHHEDLREMWNALRQMSAEGKPIDLITLTQWLADNDRLDMAGGIAGVTDAATFVPTPEARAGYATILRDKWLRREAIFLANEVTGLARKEAQTTDELLAEVELRMMGLREKAGSQRQNPVRHVREAVVEAVEHIDKVYRSRGSTVGLETGVHDLDRMTGGLRGSQMVIVAGRPSHGKSSLGMQFALHAAVEKQVPTLVFSVEMPSEQLMVRALCSYAEINLGRVRDGFFSKKDMDNLNAQMERLHAAPLFIDATPGLTSAQFRSRARAAHAAHGIGLIIVDYLQIMRGSSKRAKENRQMEVAEISMTLKMVANELNIPVVAMAQLNRDAEEYGLPKLSHLRDSGSIEQDADMVLLIHRLDKKRGKKKDGDDEDKPDHNCLLMLEKQRNGPTGHIKLQFDSAYTHFRNVTAKRYSNNEDERQH